MSEGMPCGRRAFTLVELRIVCVIVAGLACVAATNFRAARERANTRACFANQKTLLGAAEMHWLDQRSTRGRVTADRLAHLIAAGALRSAPLDPGFGAGSWIHYEFARDGLTFRCRIHGGLSGEAPDPSGTVIQVPLRRAPDGVELDLNGEAIAQRLQADALRLQAEQSR